MSHAACHRHLCAAAAVLALALLSRTPAVALDLGPQEMVLSGGGPINVGSYSVPSCVDWNRDGAPDLVVGTKEADGSGKVRVYLNTGSAAAPTFDGHFFVQSGGADIDVGSSGCMGAFVRVYDWNADHAKDLLIGTSDPAKVRWYANIGTEDAPVFDGYTHLWAGTPGNDIDVGARATLCIKDWDRGVEKLNDLVMGDGDGNVRFYRNSGSGHKPGLDAFTYVQADGSPIDIGVRSSPCVADLNGDGCVDLLVGEGDGKLYQFLNTTGDPGAVPVLGAATLLEADGAAIQLGFRTRPCVVDWTGDDRLDVLVGDSSGNVYLYQGVPEPATLCLVAAGAVCLRTRKRRSR